MPLFRINDKTIHFRHVPKCGGTSIENALREKGVELGFINPAWWREKQRLWYKSSPQHISVEDLRTLLPDSLFDYQFAIVRDPVARFISAFNHNRRARRIWPLSTLESFLSRIEQRKDFYGWEMDNHFLPASRFISESCEVFRLEDGFDAAVERLKTITSGALCLEPRHENVRVLNDPTSETAVRHFVKAHLMPRVPSKKELPPDLLERIRTLYREDCDRFGL